VCVCVKEVSHTSMMKAGTYTITYISKLRVYIIRIWGDDMTLLSA
jgi:hypothetical protein